VVIVSIRHCGYVTSLVGKSIYLRLVKYFEFNLFTSIVRIYYGSVYNMIEK
jgi:hypothetical protein